MIEIRGIDADNVPYIVCDSCGEEITKVHEALAIFRNHMDNGEKSNVLHVHKNYVKGDCLKIAEDYFYSRGWESGCDALGQHLAYLIHNAGMTPKEIKERLY